MKQLFFSGFSLAKENEIFEPYLTKSEFVASGFSYGAIKLIESLSNDISENEKKRIDKIQLFSPSFFNDKEMKYKRLQLLFFKKNPNLYCDTFLKNCGFSSEEKKKYFQIGTYDELEELLFYQWDELKMRSLIQKNIYIETFLGENDLIIDSKNALKFFRKFGDVYFIKKANHTLRLI